MIEFHLRRKFFGVSLLMAVFFSPFCADAGQVLLPQTGQKNCWDASGNEISCSNTGQDGELLKGEGWPTPRFVQDDEIIADNLTGLLWAKDANLIMTRDPEFDNDGATGDGCVTWQNALAYIAMLNQGNYGGHSDWRLPNIRELKSLINYGESSPSGWLTLTGQGFADVQEGYYWSSTTAALSPSQAWTAAVWFGDLTVQYKTNSLYLWPVCGGMPRAATVVLPRTGQQTCWNEAGAQIGCKFPVHTGLDGDFQMGEPWPLPRFTANNLTIVDNLTILSWTKEANAPGPAACLPGGSKTWQEALTYVKCLNETGYLGYQDWRLPNINEIESLVSYEVNYEENTDNLLSVSQWLATGENGFTDVWPGSYWSSASVAGDPAFAWGINMYAGYLNAFDKSAKYYVWPTRTASYLIGDLNGDRRVNMTDAVFALQLLVHNNKDSVREDYPTSGADVNDNGRIGLEEVIYILQQTAEIN
jgi:hypothetical protein